jgi:hypothetical protein
VHTLASNPYEAASLHAIYKTGFAHDLTASVEAPRHRITVIQEFAEV